METAKVAVRKNGLDFGFMKADCVFSGVFEGWVTTGGDSGRIDVSHSA
jgi:putative transposon-encoded protein